MVAHPPPPQGVDWVAWRIPSFGPVLWISQPLIMERTHPRFLVWAPRLLLEVHAHPGALGVCAQAAAQLIWYTLISGFGPVHPGQQGSDHIVHPPGV